MAYIFCGVLLSVLDMVAILSDSENFNIVSIISHIYFSIVLLLFMCLSIMETIRGYKISGDVNHRK